MGFLIIKTHNDPEMPGRCCLFSDQMLSVNIITEFSKRSQQQDVSPTLRWLQCCTSILGMKYRYVIYLVFAIFCDHVKQSSEYNSGESLLQNTLQHDSSEKGQSFALTKIFDLMSLLMSHLGQSRSSVSKTCFSHYLCSFKGVHKNVLEVSPKKNLRIFRLQSGRFNEDL